MRLTAQQIINTTVELLALIKINPDSLLGITFTTFSAFALKCIESNEQLFEGIAAICHCDILSMKVKR